MLKFCQIALILELLSNKAGFGKAFKKLYFQVKQQTVAPWCLVNWKKVASIGSLGFFKGRSLS
jgi:hypothetical protein